MYLEKIREERPLIHHITNYVVANETANLTLAFGALPVMSHSIDEVGEMVSHARALLLNIGTLDKLQVESMIVAGKEANNLDIPVILDPVGAGATFLRTDSARKIMKEVKIAAIRGNIAEVSILAGYQAAIAGVEALGGEEIIETSVKELAHKWDCLVCATGVTDYVSDGRRLALIKNGHPMLSTVTGTGCMATTTLAIFLSIGEDRFESAVEGLAAFGIIGELAAKKADKQPGSFHQEIYNVTYNLTDETISRMKKVEIV